MNQNQNQNQNQYQDQFINENLENFNKGRKWVENGGNQGVKQNWSRPPPPKKKSFPPIPPLRSNMRPPPKREDEEIEKEIFTEPDKNQNWADMEEQDDIPQWTSTHHKFVNDKDN